MFFNLLAEENPQNQGSPIGTYIMLAVAIVLLVVMFIFNSRSQKKKQEEKITRIFTPYYPNKKK